MLCSTTLTAKAIENYQNAKKRQTREGLDGSSDRGSSAAMEIAVLVIAIIFLVLEFLVLFYAVSIAINCTKGGRDRIVHLVLAVTFTLPYMLFNVFFGKCGQDYLGQAMGTM